MKPFTNQPLALLALALTLAILSPCPSSLAQWSTNPTANNPICTSTGNQRLPSIISDGAGGAIITWMDLRVGNADVYAQRINVSGVVEWAVNGVAISSAALAQEYPMLTRDGAGGAIIAWQDNRAGDPNYNIYARRITASGAVQWTADGVPICVLAGIQGKPQIVSDDSGGAIITWEDGRGTNYDIYAQRIDSTGAVLWSANGVVICAAVGAQRRPMIVTDGASGAIITWYDQRVGGDNDVYVQRINAAGAVQWAANGVAISTASSFQIDPSIVSDGIGGAIVTWYDFRNGANYDIYAQRINAAGTVQWTPDGDTVCVAAGAQDLPVIVTDGARGAIITWSDRRTGTVYDVYAQRIDSSGVGVWTTNGALISGAANDQAAPSIVSDGTGGAVISWHDRRTNGFNYDVFAQHINALGTVQWIPNGVAISTATENQTTPTMLGDDAGGAIVVWEDFRVNPNWDIYATRIFADGALPIQLASFTGAVISAGVVRLDWLTLSEINNYGFEVQHKRAGEPEFQPLPNGFIPGHGTTNEPHSYMVEDSIVSQGQWHYRLKQIDLDGTVHYSEPIQVDVLTGVEQGTTPLEFALSQNYPNPFNPNTTIQFVLPKSGQVELKVYTVLGQEVATLVNEVMVAGTYSLRWNANSVASGAYIFRLSSGSLSQTKRMLLLR